jgi:hypothetical protein
MSQSADKAGMVTDGRVMAAKTSAQAGQGFYLCAALTCALIAVIGFARSYYLKPLFETPPLPTLLHVHGAIMSAWCLLFGAQSYLVRTHRVHLHRRMGILGAVLAILVVVVGTHATVEATAREVRDHVIHRFHFLFGLNLVNLLVFAILVVTALALRARPDFHKRLMLLATVTMLAPAIARIVLLFTHDAVAQILAFDFCIFACVAVDTVLHRRLHPAFGWGAAFVVGAFHLIFIALSTKWWLPFVAWVFS